MERTLVISGAAWGTHYTDMLVNYCLPSMLPSIGAVLSQRRVILLLYTDDREKVECSPSMVALRSLGVDDMYSPVDDDTKHGNYGLKYALLGKYQGLGVDYARSWHADYHSLMPDHVYSSEFFSGLMAAVNRGHRVITRLCLSTNLDGMGKGLEPYKNGCSISIGCADLAALALKNLHARAQGWRVKDGRYPDIHVAFFEGMGVVTIISPHQSVAYIDREEILPVLSPMPLDSELGRLVAPGCAVYCPSAEDRMGWVEMARADAGTEGAATSSAAEFARRYWEVVGTKHRKYLGMETVDPVAGGVAGDFVGLDELRMALRG